jgi:hypothetical protein
MSVAMPSTSKDKYLQRRLRSGVSILKSDWIPRKYFCSKCNRVFDIRASLVRHRIYECGGSQEPTKREGKRKPSTLGRSSRRSIARNSRQQQQQQQQQQQPRLRQSLCILDVTLEAQEVRVRR